MTNTYRIPIKLSCATVHSTDTAVRERQHAHAQDTYPGCVCEYRPDNVCCVYLCDVADICGRSSEGGVGR